MTSDLRRRRLRSGTDLHSSCFWSSLRPRTEAVCRSETAAAAERLLETCHHCAFNTNQSLFVCRNRDS